MVHLLAAMLCASLSLAAGCDRVPGGAAGSGGDPAVARRESGRLATDQTSPACQVPCSAGSCNGCDPKQEQCDRQIVNGEFGVKRWPDPDIGPNRVDATIHKTAACGGVKWPFATTNHVCSTFSTWLADDKGNELPHTRYDSPATVVQIYGNMWSGAASACASVCGQTVCSQVDR